MSELRVGLRVVAMSVLVAGCGSKPKPAKPVEPVDPAVAAASAERDKLDAEKPVAPYETRAVHGFKSPAVCGQGPYRIPAAALGTRYGERVQVTICARHAVEADYRFTRGKETSEPQHFGWGGGDSSRCVATATELATAGGAGSSGASAGTTGRATRPAAKATPAATSFVLEEVAVASDKCPDGMFPTSIVDHGFETSAGTALDAKTPLVVDVWSAQPMHLEGAIFIVHQTAPRADLTEAQWRDYQDRYNVWYERYRAFVDRELQSGRSRIVDTTAKSAEAPPPPRAESQPPRPSTHADWIPGYWHRETDWVWIEGFWRVPEEDIVADRTVHAPVAPPPERVEPVTPRPATVAVWTPGYWSWDGRAYVWVVGAWRIPPVRGRQWIAPTWRPRAGGVVVFVPGGWRR